MSKFFSSVPTGRRCDKEEAIAFDYSKVTDRLYIAMRATKSIEASPSRCIVIASYKDLRLSIDSRAIARGSRVLSASSETGIISETTLSIVSKRCDLES